MYVYFDFYYKSGYIHLMCNPSLSDNSQSFCGFEEMYENHPLISLVQNFEAAVGIDDDSHLHLVKLLGEYLIEHSLFRSSSYNDTLGFVYGLNDNELYTVISAPHNSHYDFFVLHSDYFHPRSTQHKHFRNIRFTCVNYLKDLNRYEGESLSSQLKMLGTTLTDIQRILTYTARRATGVREQQEIVYPPFNSLKRFYECERKVRYDSLQDGLKNCEEWNNVFRCEHCNYYHQGRPRQVAPEDVDPAKVLKRYQVTWKRYQSTGRLNEVTMKNNHDG